MTQFLPTLLFLLILLVLSAFFSGSEASIFSLSKMEKKRLSARHPKTWKTISRLSEHPRRTLITILIGNMLVNTLASAIITSLCLRLFGATGVGLVITLFSIILVIFGDLIPKVFSIRYNEFMAFISSRPLDLFAKMIYPIRRLIRLTSDFILSALIRGHHADADLVSETELKALAQIGEEEGVLKTQENEMIQNLINLGGRIVREIMIARTDMVAFNIEDGRDALRDLIKRYHFSYFPVYEGSMDNLLGVISTQQFMLDTQNRLKELIELPLYIPETKLIDELLQDLQKKGNRVAICVDEYGGTAGLVTLEDVLEEIFGEFYDEYAKAEPLIRTADEGVYHVQAKIGLHELREHLGITLKSETSETLSGWLLEQFGSIPKQNETLKHDDVQFIVREVTKQRILKVEIRK